MTEKTQADAPTGSKEPTLDQFASQGDDETNKAIEEAAEASAAEAERQDERAKKQQEFNEQAYQESIEGQELPPSVQEEQDAAAKAAPKAKTTESKTTEKG